MGKSFYILKESGGWAWLQVKLLLTSKCSNSTATKKIINKIKKDIYRTPKV
jgi:hypothetical protein